jgi:hypothetical protein
VSLPLATQKRAQPRVFVAISPIRHVYTNEPLILFSGMLPGAELAPSRSMKPQRSVFPRRFAPDGRASPVSAERPSRTPSCLPGNASDHSMMGPGPECLAPILPLSTSSRSSLTHGRHSPLALTHQRGRLESHPSCASAGPWRVGRLAFKRRRGQDAVESEKPEYGQRLIVNAYHCHESLVGPDSLEESDDCTHPRAIDQTQMGQIHKQS